MYAMRERECVDCGTVVKGRLSPSKDVRCIECAINHAAESARELANKSGVHYDRWLATRGPQGRPRKS